jgi:hypothetical protein
MKKACLLLVLAVLTYVYFNQAPFTPPPERPPVDSTPASRLATAPVEAIVVAPTPSYQARWKYGLTAQNDWKTGINAQTEFEPFAPGEQATWNQTPGYTIVSGVRFRR